MGILWLSFRFFPNEERGEGDISRVLWQMKTKRKRKADGVGVSTWESKKSKKRISGVRRVSNKVWIFIETLNGRGEWREGRQRTSQKT